MIPDISQNLGFLVFLIKTVLEWKEISVTLREFFGFFSLQRKSWNSTNPWFLPDWKTEIKPNLPLCHCSVCFPSDCVIPKKIKNHREWFGGAWLRFLPFLGVKSGMSSSRNSSTETSPTTSLSLLGVSGKLRGHSHPLEVTHPNCYPEGEMMNPGFVFRPWICRWRILPNVFLGKREF